MPIKSDDFVKDALNFRYVKDLTDRGCLQNGLVEIERKVLVANKGWRFKGTTPMSKPVEI
jgi:hypothetical protein